MNKPTVAGYSHPAIGRIRQSGEWLDPLHLVMRYAKGANASYDLESLHSTRFQDLVDSYRIQINPVTEKLVSSHPDAFSQPRKSSIISRALTLAQCLRLATVAACMLPTSALVNVPVTLKQRVDPVELSCCTLMVSSPVLVAALDTLASVAFTAVRLVLAFLKSETQVPRPPQTAVSICHSTRQCSRHLRRQNLSPLDPPRLESTELGS